MNFLLSLNYIKEIKTHSMKSFSCSVKYGYVQALSESLVEYH